MGSVVCAVGLAVLALVDAGETAGGIGAQLFAAAFLALLVALVLGWATLGTVSLVLLGAAYAVHLSVDDVSLDATAPLFAAGLLTTAELCFWSLEERERVRGEPGDGFRRLGFVALLGLGALFVGAVLLAVVDLGRAGGLALDLVGAAAAAAVLLALVLAARRPFA